jgi:glycerophosphoryl diester phosphodiesterase
MGLPEELVDRAAENDREVLGLRRRRAVRVVHAPIVSTPGEYDIGKTGTARRWYIRAMDAESRREAPRPLAALREATRRVAGDWKAHALYGLVVSVAASVLLLPFASWLLAWSLDAAAGGSVVNTGIAPVVLSVKGVVFLIVASILAGVIAVVAGAGHAYLAAATAAGRHATVREVFLNVLSDLPRVPGLGAVKVAILAALGVPVLGAAVASLASVLLVPLQGLGDLRGFVPRGLPVPLWMVGAAMGVLLVVFAWLYVRWSLAIAALTLDGVSLTEAVRQSARRTRGSWWRIGLAHLAHCLGIALAFGIILFVLRLVGRPIVQALFARSDEAGAIGMALFLALFWALGGLLGILATARLVTLTVVHHVALGGAIRHPDGAPAGRRWRLGLPLLAALAAVAFAVTTALAIPKVHAELQRAMRPTVVTAHRAGMIDAPENTMAALRRAVEVGAHSAEIDIQQAKDGSLMVVHDPNLKRLAGVDENVWELSLEELRALDVGSHHSEKFRGEKIPTLEEALDFARDRIVLNLELKTNRHETAAFIPDFVAMIRRKDFVDRCFVTSLEARFLTEVRRLEPRLRIGVIITAKVGSGEDLDVDIYSVQPLIATTDFIRRAHLSGREVHVWTLNERADMRRFIDRAADAMITDDPRLAREVLDARTPADGLRAAARRLFGLD